MRALRRVVVTLSNILFRKEFARRGSANENGFDTAFIPLYEQCAKFMRDSLRANGIPNEEFNYAFYITNYQTDD